MNKIPTTATTTFTTPTPTTSKLASPLVQYIKRKNPRLGIARIVKLIELQEQYAAEILPKSSDIDTLEASLAKPIWDVSLLSAFSWSYSYAPDSLWNALEQGKQTIHSVRSLIGKGVI